MPNTGSTVTAESDATRRRSRSQRWASRSSVPLHSSAKEPKVPGKSSLSQETEGSGVVGDVAVDEAPSPRLAAVDLVGVVVVGALVEVGALGHLVIRTREAHEQSQDQEEPDRPPSGARSRVRSPVARPRGEPPGGAQTGRRSPPRDRLVSCLRRRGRRSGSSRAPTAASPTGPSRCRPRRSVVVAKRGEARSAGFRLGWSCYETFGHGSERARSGSRLQGTWTAVARSRSRGARLLEAKRRSSSTSSVAGSESRGAAACDRWRRVSPRISRRLTVAEDSLPLEGIRVVEVATWIAAPVAATIPR